MKHQHHARRVAATAASGLALLTSACGGGSGTSGAPVTVTVIPTVTAGSGTATTTPGPARATSDVMGRAYDFGTIVRVSTISGATVIELDRWTWKGLDDAKLAKQGVPLTPFKGPVPYENQNDKLTYTIPVVAGARVLYHHCVAATQPLQTKSVTVKYLLGLADRENTVLVQLDSSGRLTAADNVAGCPG